MGSTQLSEEERQAMQAEWLGRLSHLIESVREWAEELDWSARRITKRMEDSELGQYEAPALLLQKETTRVMLEPIARSAPGAEGVVDLYLMPAFDDVASLYYHDGLWRFYRVALRQRGDSSVEDAAERPLSRESVQEILESMVKDAAQPL